MLTRDFEDFSTTGISLTFYLKHHQHLHSTTTTTINCTLPATTRPGDLCDSLESMLALQLRQASMQVGSVVVQ
jgi:hypothetical protein